VKVAVLKNSAKVKGMMYDQPQLMHQLLDKLAETIIQYLNAQIESGAEAVMIFDTWGGVLTTRDYKEFSLRYMQKIVDGLKRENNGRKVHVVMFSKGGGQW